MTPSRATTSLALSTVRIVGRYAAVLAGLVVSHFPDVGAAAVVPQAAGGQVTVSAELSTDTVAIGDIFEVHVSVTVPGGQMVYFPDSLDSAEGYAPLGPVEWTVRTDADGISFLSIVYPLITFDVGSVTTAEFGIFAATRSASVAEGPRDRNGVEEGDRRTQGEVVGSWSALPELRNRQESGVSLRRVSVPAQHVWVTSVLLLDDISQGITPRPAADVAGDDWHWPSLLLVIACTLALGGVLTASARDLVGREKNEDEISAGSRSAREVALDALDRLMESGLHSDGRMHDFYASGSDIVRRYVETLDPDWDATRTSTELMRVLNERVEGACVDKDFLAEMRTAERVKFGMLRPVASVAEAHLRTLRGWVEHSAAAET